MGGQGVATGVDANTRPTGYVVVEAHVRRLRLVELHVPIAVGGYLLVKTLAQRDLGERRAVRWEGASRERSTT